MWVLLKRQADFVKYNAPQVLIDNLLANGLNFVLVILAGPTVVGYFSYLSRILKAPLGLVFGAVSQVVFRFAAKNSREIAVVAREIRRVYVIVIVVLAAAVLGVGVVYVAFDSISMLKDWAGLRQHLLAFATWMLIPFLFSPFATLPVVYGRQKQFFVAAATFNSLSLLAFAVLIGIVSVNAAFWVVALLSVPYYLGLNFWLSRVISHE